MNALHPETLYTATHRNQTQGPEARRQQMMDHFEWNPVTVQANHQQGQTFSLVLAFLARSYGVEM